VGFAEHGLEADRERDDFVGRRLVDCALDVGARIDPGDEARRRIVVFLAGHRVQDADPRIVEGRVAGIEERPQRTHLRNALLFGAVDDGDAIPHSLGVPDQVPDDRLGPGVGRRCRRRA
jgi:hypothetical protein